MYAAFVLMSDFLKAITGLKDMGLFKVPCGANCKMALIFHLV